MSAHTPGPWNYHAQGDANEYVLLTNEKRWVIAFRQNGEILTPEQEANVRLIAKSPELLKILKEMLDCYRGLCCDPEGDSLITDAEVVINQIEGV